DFAVGSGLAPQLAGREPHRIEGIGDVSTAMGRDVIDVVGTVEADDRATLSLHIARCTGVSGWMPCAYADVVTDRVPRRRVRGEVTRQHPAIGSGQGKTTASTALEFVLGGETRLDSHGCGTGQPALVVQRRQVVLGRHALDRMTEPSPRDALRCDQS